MRLSKLWKTLFFNILLVLPVLAGAQVTSDFSGTPLSGCSPLVVQFSDLSTGPVTSWSWNFGNGNTSTLQNPAAVYVTPGTYTVTLTVSDGTNSDTRTQTNYITVFQNPTANFTNASPTNGCVPHTVCFTDLSTPGDGAINGWLWDFGDGNTSTAQNPCHTYSAAGSFNVTLVATDVNGCNHTLVIPNFVNTSTPPVAAFVGAPLAACVPPLTVNFTNNTTGGAAPVTYQWDFGDGNTSTQANPSNTYNALGSYTVSLIATDANGCADTVTLAAYVNINNVTAAFTQNTTNICAGQSVTFTDQSTNATMWAWDFGDGGTSTAQNPTYTYATPGTYTVTLTASNGACNDVITQTNLITVTPAPTANFVADTTNSCEVPFVVNFTDLSTGNPVSWAWDFGDGNTSTLQNPQHTYTAPGTYSVTLTVTDGNGCPGTVVFTNYITIVPPVADFVAVPLNGCVPLPVAFTDLSTSNEPIVSWQWDFGDGNTSTAQNPNHTYTTTGAFTVTLIIVNSAGCTDTLVRPAYIQVGDVPIACFTWNPPVACVNDPITFTDCSVNATSWFWDFGDGGTSNAQNPTYAYQDTGCFTVTLVVSNFGCTDDTIIQNAVCIGPPVAQFALNPQVGCAVPHTVFFTDQSILPDTWFWDFGDGNTSTLQNPVHNYTATGNYTVTLTVTDTITGCTDDATATVNVSVPVADFSGGPLFGCGPLTVNFNDLSTGPPVTWAWDFGDGGTSTVQNPTYTYQTPGVYTVTLTITDANGCTDTRTRTSYVQVIGPDVNFGADTLLGCDSLLVNFTDSTIFGAPITSWTWDFGDGNTSNLQNPTHFYNAPGTYTVSLTVTDIDGCSRTFTRNNYIFINSLNAGFTVNDTIGCAGVTFNFTNNSTGTGLTYLWDFGDGNTSTATNPSHTYANNGSYTVSLFLFDGNVCRDTFIVPNLVDIQDVVANFGAVPTNASCPPLLVSFTDSSYWDIVSWEWDFGDGTGSTLQNPGHVYTQAGSYDVQLIVVNNDGCTDTLLLPGLVNIQGPNGNFTFAPDSGCTPQNVTFQATATNTATYTWDFGDGNVAITTTDSVDHVYTQTGTFFPILILDDGLGCTYSVISPDSIVIDTIPFVNFAVATNVICGIDSARFTDLTVSTRPITNWFWDFGDGNTDSVQNPVHLYAGPGTYNVTLGVVNSLGCTDTITLPAAINILEPPTAAFNPSDTIGCLPLLVNFTDQSTGPQPITAWNWDFGTGATAIIQNPAANFTSVGTFPTTLIVTDSAGCMDTIARNITINPGPTASFTADDPIGCPPHPVTFTAGTGMGIVSWNWDFGDGNTGSGNPVAHTYTASGNYTVTLVVMDTLGCTDTLVRNQYIQINPPVANFTQSNTSGCPPLTVTFTDNSTGTNTLVAWNWDFGDGTTGTGTPVSHTYAMPGVYSVTLIVTDIEGCMDTLVKPNLVNVFEPPVAGFEIVDTLACVPFTIELGDTSTSAASTIVGWNWDFGDGNTSVVQNPIHGYAAPGPYTITLIVTDANGCMDTTNMPFVVPVQPVANFVASDSLGCAPFLTTFTADTTNGIVYFEWDFGDGSPIAFGNPVSHTYTANGSFTVTLIVEDRNGCRDTLSRPNYIQINPPTADFTQNNTMGCPPLTVTFSDNSTNIYPIVNWAWDFGDGTTGSGAPVTHTYALPGVYTVTLIVTDSIGCMDTIVKPNLITVFEPPVAGFEFVDTLNCVPFTIELGDTSTSAASTIVAWNWDFGDGNTSVLQNPIHPYQNPGPYVITLIVTDGNGCMDTTSTPFVVPLPPQATFTATDSIGCPPMTTTFTGGTAGGIVYWEWDFGDGSPIAFGNPITHTYTATGNFNVTLIVEDSIGCRDTLVRPQYIQINPPAADFTQDVTQGCPPLTVTFTDLSQFTNTIVAWDWDFGDGTTGSGTPVTHTYNTPGVYTVTLIITDSIGCMDTIVKPNLITVFAPPTALFGITDTLACDPFTIQLTDSSSGTAAVTGWNWDFGDGGTSTLQNPTHGYVTPGPYTITLIVTDANGCMDTTSLPFVVPVRPQANFIAIDSVGCAPLDVLFIADSTDIVNYTWDFGDGNGTVGGPIVSHLYPFRGTYSVTLIIEDIYGCFDTLTKPNYIFVDSLDADFSSNVSVGCPPATVQFTDLSFSDTTIVSWNWDFGDGGTSTLQNPTHIYNTPGAYNVTLIVTNAIGCMDTLVGPQLDIYDQDPPGVPPILMATVESNTTDSISWRAYTGPDFSHYVLYWETPTGSNVWTPVDSFFNSLDTSYTHTGLNTLNNSYCYRLQIVDVCGLRSSLDSSRRHCTIDLEATPGIDQAILNWSAYVGWDSVFAYDIYRVTDYNQANASLIGSVGGGVTTYIDSSVVCYEEYCYRIRAREAGGFLETAWSDTSCALPIHIAAPIPLEMCAASVLNDSFVEITWTIPPGLDISLMFLDKSTDGQTFGQLTTLVPGQTSFVDTDVRVDDISYYYRISYIDSCGDMSPFSNVGRTMVLTAEMLSQAPNLDWNQYEDWSAGILNYRIEVLSDVTGQWQFVDVTPDGTTDYFDLLTNLDQPIYCYRVSAEQNGGGCRSLSNTACVPVGPRLYAPNAFTPNADGLNDFFELKGLYIADYNIQIYDRWGALIFESNSLDVHWDGTWRDKPCQEGVYVWLATGRGFDGTVIEKRGTATLIR